MQLTPYHAKYFAYELTKRNASDSMQKLASTLVDAQVDLNPHQVEAALFAFRSPLSSSSEKPRRSGRGCKRLNFKFFIVCKIYPVLKSTQNVTSS